MLDVFTEVFAAQATAVAASLLLTLVLFIAFDGRKGWLGRVSQVSHFCGVIVQGYIGWTALDALVAATVQTGTSKGDWFSVLGSTATPAGLEPYLVCHGGGPLDALLFFVSLHIARLMWVCIRPKESVQYLTHRQDSRDPKPSK